MTPRYDAMHVQPTFAKGLPESALWGQHCNCLSVRRGKFMILEIQVLLLTLQYRQCDAHDAESKVP